MRPPLLLAVLLLAACNKHFTPLQNRIAVGKQGYVVFVADGVGGQGDLYAVDAFGGHPWPFTYSLASESHPALDPSGVMLAFIRGLSDTSTTGRKVWVMNLLNGREREMTLPAGVVPSEVVWSRDGSTLYIATSTGLWSMAAPPAPLAPSHLSGADSARADSALAVMVGDPPFARIAPCRPGADAICAFIGTKPPAPVDSPATGPLRWGPDSLGFFVGERLIVRPVGPGKGREVRIEQVPDHPRQATWFKGPDPDTGRGTPGLSTPAY